MNFLKLYLFLLPALIITAITNNTARAQNDCAITLKQAEKLYDEGAIDSIPSLLDSCMKSGFSKKEKLQAYRLFTLINLYEDKITEAEKYMLKFLSLEPEYEANRSIEEPEFLNLFDKFITSPIWAYGVYAGVNFTNISTSQEYGVNNMNLTSALTSSSGFSFQFGLKYSRYLYKNLDFNADLQFAQNKYTNTKSIFDFSSISFEETQSRISLPLSITYDLTEKKIKPYLRLGLSVGYLISSKATIIKTYSDNSHAEVKGSDMDLNHYRNPINLWGIAGVGIKYKIKRGNIFLDMRYNWGLFNQTKSVTRYDNNELIYKYYYIDNDFTISNLAVSLGYVYLLYKPSKK